jgi:membrane protease YdiL (CAAX protease family)
MALADCDYGANPQSIAAPGLIPASGRESNIQKVHVLLRRSGGSMHWLDAWIRSLSAGAEIAIVVCVAFGWFIVGSLWAFGDTLAPSYQFPSFTERDLGELVLQEIASLVVLGWFLWRRGWTLRLLGVVWTERPVKRSLALAIGHQALWTVALILCAMVPVALIYAVLAQVVPESMAATAAPFVAPGIGLGAILAVSVVNPIFEELFVCSYLVSRLAPRYGAWTAIHVSTAIRLTYHLYQGPIAALSIVPVGLVFAYWYVQRKQLWPVIAAHAYFDFTALYAPA